MSTNIFLFYLYFYFYNFIIGFGVVAGAHITPKYLILFFMTIFIITYILCYILCAKITLEKETLNIPSLTTSILTRAPLKLTAAPEDLLNQDHYQTHL